MMKRALLLATLALSQSAVANEMNQFWQDSTYKWNFRYRLENVQPEGPLKDALASTLRSRLTVNTGKWTVGNHRQISALIEADHVARIGVGGARQLLKFRVVAAAARVGQQYDCM